MRPINLISFVDSMNQLSKDVFKEYLNEFQIYPKESELLDIKQLVSEFNENKAGLEELDQYYIGYKINQISKEFDLLRFGKDYIVNIELKSKKSKEDIRTQLIENQYYLSSINENVYSFTYVSVDKILYKLNEDKQLVECDFESLISVLRDQELLYIDNLDNIFNPSNFLISPFNTTEKFIKGNYFLTDHQRQMKREMMDNDELIKSKFKFISIEGSAGTGKTLFAYDISKQYIDAGKKVLIIHCGITNEGHEILNNKYHWTIIPIKDVDKYDLNGYDLILIDETQRIRKTQLEQIINSVNESNSKCIFSYDKAQYLSKSEKDNKIPEYIDELVNPKKFKLTGKIRTNKEIASFIKNLFDLSARDKTVKYSNINIKYFSKPEDARRYMSIICNQGWKIINYTPPLYGTYPYEKFKYPSAETAHKVIGQEFDNIVAVIDEYFYYETIIDTNTGKKKKVLSIINYRITPIYDPRQMLFQILTRTRKKLTLIIINNEELLKECIGIINNK